MYYENAVVAYAAALDEVERCLKTGQSPYVSNYTLSKIGMYHAYRKSNRGQSSSPSSNLGGLSILMLIFFAIAAYYKAMQWWSERALWEQALMIGGVVGFIILNIALSIKNSSIKETIKIISGGSTCQSALILNELIMQRIR